MNAGTGSVYNFLLYNVPNICLGAGIERGKAVRADG